MDDKRKKFSVGVNIFVLRDKKLLLGKRKNVYGDGTWGLPGGHLEYGEHMERAALRELEEETGLKAKKFTFANLINDFHDDQHYLQIGFLAQEVDKAEPALEEPDRTEKWEWFDLDNLPDKIFISHVKQIQAFRENSYFLESH
jgi:8-oxo-dGTP diphosphatase